MLCYIQFFNVILSDKILYLRKEICFLAGRTNIILIINIQKNPATLRTSRRLFKQLS